MRKLRRCLLKQSVQSRLQSKSAASTHAVGAREALGISGTLTHENTQSTAQRTRPGHLERPTTRRRPSFAQAPARGPPQRERTSRPEASARRRSETPGSAPEPRLDAETPTENTATGTRPAPVNNGEPTDLKDKIEFRPLRHITCAWGSGDRVHEGGASATRRGMSPPAGSTAPTEPAADSRRPPPRPQRKGRRAV